MNERTTEQAKAGREEERNEAIAAAAQSVVLLFLLFYSVVAFFSPISMTTTFRPSTVGCDGKDERCPVIAE